MDFQGKFVLFNFVLSDGFFEDFKLGNTEKSLV